MRTACAPRRRPSQRGWGRCRGVGLSSPCTVCATRFYIVVKLLSPCVSFTLAAGQKVDYPDARGAVPLQVGPCGEKRFLAIGGPKNVDLAGHDSGLMSKSHAVQLMRRMSKAKLAGAAATIKIDKNRIFTKNAIFQKLIKIWFWGG